MVNSFVKMPSCAVLGPPGTRRADGNTFHAPNRGNPLPNNSYALNKKDTLHPARVIYDIVVRYIKCAGLEFCDAAYTNYQFSSFKYTGLNVGCHAGHFIEESRAIFSLVTLLP